MKSDYTSRWDAIGISASMICAVHCVALSVIFSSLPFLGVEILGNPVIEGVIITISLFVGSWALYKGFQKHHKIFLLIIFIAGMIALFFSVIIITNQFAEIICKAFAAACIITAHSLNWKYSKQFHSQLAK